MYPKHYLDLFRPDVRQDMVFVGMSFHPSDAFRWEAIIKPAIADVGMIPYRVDMGVVSDSILTDILKGILQARILVFDITADHHGNRNGNVMYEIGIAHAVRQPEEVLIIRSDTDRLLFDVQGIRVINYDIGNPDAARESLATQLIALRAGLVSLRESLLVKVISGLDEVCLGFLASHAAMTYFSLQDAGKAFSPETVAGRAAIRHLLDDGVLSLVWDRTKQHYAYTWTYFGRALLEHLGFNTADEAANDEQRQRYNYRQS